MHASAGTMSALQSAPVRLLSRARAEQFSRLLLQGSAPFSSETSIKAPSAPSTSDAPTAPKPEKEEAWTEVVHSTGQIYYWNQKTGETTQLGEPKPDGKGGSAGGEGGSGEQQGSGAQDDARSAHLAESHMPDQTGYYAGVGVFVGALLGWSSQFF